MYCRYSLHFESPLLHWRIAPLPRAGEGLGRGCLWPREDRKRRRTRRGRSDAGDIAGAGHTFRRGNRARAECGGLDCYHGARRHGGRMVCQSCAAVTAGKYLGRRSGTALLRWHDNTALLELSLLFSDTLARPQSATISPFVLLTSLAQANRVLCKRYGAVFDGVRLSRIPYFGEAAVERSSLSFRLN